MGARSRIGWTDASWNPVTGCTEVSPGCDHCYARGIAERFAGTPAYPQGFKVTLHPERLVLPLRWAKPRQVFVNSMSDLFHADVPDGYIARAWEVMAQAPQHTFQILTKRHARMRSWVTRWHDTTGDELVDGIPMPRGPEAVRAVYSSPRARLFADMLDSMGTPPPGAAYPLYDWMEGPRWFPNVLHNVWLGVSAEDDARFALRVPALLATPAAVRFLSAEPLIGRIQRAPIRLAAEGGLHWVIVGGESGPGARRMDPSWVDDIVETCQAYSVSVFVKQLGSVLAKELSVPGKGDDPSLWPDELRSRWPQQWPVGHRPTGLTS